MEMLDAPTRANVRCIVCSGLDWKWQQVVAIIREPVRAHTTIPVLADSSARITVPMCRSHGKIRVIRFVTTNSIAVA